MAAPAQATTAHTMAVAAMAVWSVGIRARSRTASCCTIVTREVPPPRDQDELASQAEDHRRAALYDAVPAEEEDNAALPRSQHVPRTNGRRETVGGRLGCRRRRRRKLCCRAARRPLRQNRSQAQSRSSRPEKGDNSTMCEMAETSKVAMLDEQAEEEDGGGKPASTSRLQLSLREEEMRMVAAPRVARP